MTKRISLNESEPTRARAKCAIRTIVSDDVIMALVSLESTLTTPPPMNHAKVTNEKFIQRW